MKSVDVREFLNSIGEERLRKDKILNGKTNLLNGRSVGNLLELMKSEGVDEVFCKERGWRLAANGEFANPKSPGLKQGHIDELGAVPRKRLGFVFRYQNRCINPLYRAKYEDQISADDVISPNARPITSMKYDRNAQVRDDVLARAEGNCEYCHKLGFTTAKGGVFLETHHVVPLSEGGEDTSSNIVALCPNDHRKAHYSRDAKKMQKELKEILKRLAK